MTDKIKITRPDEISESEYAKLLEIARLSNSLLTRGCDYTVFLRKMKELLVDLASIRGSNLV